jgi:CheY-like chemotaxis protein
MPGIDGVETMHRLLAHDSTLNIYIVTAFSREYLGDLQRAQEDGLIFQLANKPLSSSQIRHIANSVHSLRDTGTDQRKIALTLYVVMLDPDTRKILNQLTIVLAEIYQPGFWTLNVVEVLSLPEKALENEVFATPMLVREVPQPVLKLLGDLSRMHSVLAAITAQHRDVSDTVVM